MTTRPDVSATWDREYAAGRYLHEPPVAFIDDILATARRAGLRSGLYIGCGNGRNYLPLIHSGLDLVGLDISRTALEQLAALAPEVRNRLLCGDLSRLPPDQLYDLVIGIQVFQHGTRAVTHEHIRAARERVYPGGLIAMRVNAVATDIILRHEVLERSEDGGITVRYLEGPKQGLEIHFFAESELADLFADGFEPVLGPRLQTTYRRSPATGQWSQWEGIWRRA